MNQTFTYKTFIRYGYLIKFKSDHTGTIKKLPAGKKITFELSKEHIIKLSPKTKIPRGLRHWIERQ